MKAGDDMRPYFNPTIFGDKIVPLGINQAIELFETFGDPIKEAQLKNLKGIKQECENTQPDLLQQKLLKIYMKEIDRRRNTDYRQLFPTIDKLLQT